MLRFLVRTAIPALAVVATACATASIGASDDIKLPERADDSVVDEGGVLTTSEAGVTLHDEQSDAAGNSQEMDASPAADAQPDVGAWFQSIGVDCATFCSGRGATNVPSPDSANAKCTSGENIPASAIAAKITYDKCFPSCNAHLSGTNPVSFGKNCYASGQKQDGDPSDITRGCFCR
jgi:hypothetical protein